MYCGEVLDMIQPLFPTGRNTPNSILSGIKFSRSIPHFAHHHAIESMTHFDIPRNRYDARSASEACWRLQDRSGVGIVMKGAPLPPITRLNTALVLHDMQYDFIGRELSEPYMQGVIERCKNLINVAHSLDMPVIYTRYEQDPDTAAPPERAAYLRYGSGPGVCLPGTRGADVVDELRPSERDFVITKVKYTPFYGTKLEALLRAKNVWILVIAGGSVNWGIEWMARDARTLDI